MKITFGKAGLFVVILLLVEVLGVGAACTGTQLLTKNPAAGETIRIHTGECAGIIIIDYDNIAVFFEPGSGIQDNGYIKFPSTGILNNITMDVRDVIWALNRGLFYSGVTDAGLELMYSSFYFWNSTFSSSHYTTIGLLSGGSGFVSASGPSLVRSNFTVAQCQLTTNAAGKETFGLVFAGTLTNSPLVISGGSSVSATTTSGVYHAWGIYVKATITNSTLEIRDRSVVEATSNTYSPFALYFLAPFTDSTLSITDGSVVEATSSTHGAFALRFVAAFTDSTMSISDNSTIVANGPGAETTAVYFSAGASVTRPTITIANSVVQSTKYSFRHNFAAFVSNKIGTITLCLSSFSGPSDGIGPLTGTTIQQNGIGTLTIGTIYWNNVLLSPAILLPTYTSSQLTIETECHTPTRSDTQSSSGSPTNETQTSTATATTTGSSTQQSPTLSGPSLSSSPSGSYTPTQSATPSGPSISSSRSATPSAATATVSPGTSTNTPSLSFTASQSKTATPTLSHPMSQSFSLSLSDTPQTPSPSRSLSFPSPSLSSSVTSSATNTPDATPTQTESPSIQGFCPLHGAPLSSSPSSIPVVDVAYNPTTTVGINVSGSVDSLHAGHLRPEWTNQLSTDSSESAGGPTATTQSSRRLPISASLVSGPVTLISPSSPSALIGPGEWIDLALADGEPHVPVTFRLIQGTRLDEEHLVVIDFSQSSFDFPVPYSGGGGTSCNFSLVKNRVLIRLTQLVPPPLSPELLFAQEVTSATGVTIATATGSGSLALGTNAALVVAAYAMCAFSYTEHLSWMLSPTFLLIGPEEGAPFRGAVVGNLLVLFGFYLLVLTALAVRHHVLNDPTWAHSRHRLHFPGIFALPYFFLLAGTVSSSVTLIRHGDMWRPVSDPIIGSVSLLIWSLPLILFIQRTTLRFAFDATYQDEDEMELERILMNQDKVSFMEEVLLGRGHWKDNGRGFKYNWGVTFMDYKGLRQWYICVELIFALLIAAMEGFKPRTASGCQNVLIVYFVLAVLNLLIVSWARPCISKANTIHSISIAILLVASTGCLMLGGLLEVPALRVTGAYCALASSFLAGLKGLFDAACTFQRRYRTLRARFERNRRPQQDSDSMPEDPEEGAEMEERRAPGLDAPLLGIPSIVQSPVPQSESSVASEEETSIRISTPSLDSFMTTSGTTTPEPENRFPEQGHPPRRDTPQQPRPKGPVRSEESQKLYDEIRTGLNFGMGGAQFLQVQGLNLDDVLTDERAAEVDEADPDLAENGEGWDVQGGAEVGGGVNSEWDFDASPPPATTEEQRRKQMEDCL